MMSLNQTLWDDTIPICAVFAMILTVELFALFMMVKGLLKFNMPKWGPTALLCLFPMWIGIMVALSRTIAGSYLLLYLSVILYLPLCALIGSSRFRKWYIEHEKNS